jgi:hypothetical protein
MTHDRSTQSLRCNHCHESIEIPRYLIGMPESYMRFLERQTSNHAECSTFATVHEAKLNRYYLRKMKREMRKQRVV